MLYSGVCTISNFADENSLAETVVRITSLLYGPIALALMITSLVIYKNKPEYIVPYLTIMLTSVALSSPAVYSMVKKSQTFKDDLPQNPNDIENRRLLTPTNNRRIGNAYDADGDEDQDEFTIVERPARVMMILMHAIYYFSIALYSNAWMADMYSLNKHPKYVTQSATQTAAFEPFFRSLAALHFICAVLDIIVQFSNSSNKKGGSVSMTSIITDFSYMAVGVWQIVLSVMLFTAEGRDFNPENVFPASIGILSASIFFGMLIAAYAP